MSRRRARANTGELRAFFDADIVGIAVATPDGAVVDANDYYLRTIGYSRAEFEQGLVNWRAVTPPEWIAADERAIAELRATGRCTPYEKQYLRRDGTRVWVYLSDALLPGPDERIAAFILDVTDRKRTEDELRRSHESFATLFEEAPYAAVLARLPEGRIELVNEAFQNLVGLAREEIVGRTSLDLGLYVDPAQRARSAALVERQGFGHEVEAHVRDGSGGERDVLVNTTFVQIDGERRVLTTAQDVTARRRAERELVESVGRMKAVLENDAVGVMFWDLASGRLQDANEAFLRMMGYSREDVDSGLTWERLTPPEYHAESRAHIANFRVTGRIGPYEKEYLRKDGSRLWLMFTGSAVGGTEVCIEFCVDISARKQTERRLAESERRYALLFDVTPIPMWIYDVETLRFIAVNNAAIRNYGYSDAEFLAMTIADIRPSDDVARLRANVAGVRDDALDHAGLWRHVRRDGSVIDVEITSHSLDFGGRRAEVVLALDVTAKRREEESRRLTEAALRAAANGVVITDRTGEILWVNQAFSDMTGYAPEEAVGAHTRILRSGRHPPAFYQDLWNDVLAGRVWRGEVTNRRKDGSLYDEELTITPVRGADGGVTHFVAIKQDVTERRRSEQVAGRLREQLVHAQKMESIGRLAGGVAHDFNNMLGVILAHAEMALEDMSASHPLFEDLTEIRKAAQRSAELTRQLLAFARKQVVSPRNIDLNETVEGALRMLRRLIGEDVELAWKPGPEQGFVRIDPSQVDQLLANLCVNARDAIEDTGRISIATGAATLDEAYCAQHPGAVRGDYVLLSVTDDGRGMDRATVDRIFEPFFTTKDAGRGTGLGLAMVYGIVKQNGGFIDVYSEPGHGASFKLYLPRCGGPAGPPSAPGSAPGPSATMREVVLVVEDEPAILAVTAGALERAGYAVLRAARPTDALRLAGEFDGRIDLLLTDVIMPEMTGRDLARRLTQSLPSLRCLYASGYTADVISRSGVLEPGLHFIEKPFSIKALLEKVRGVLDGHSGAGSPPG